MFPSPYACTCFQAFLSEIKSQEHVFIISRTNMAPFRECKTSCSQNGQIQPYNAWCCTVITFYLLTKQRQAPWPVVWGEKCKILIYTGCLTSWFGKSHKYLDDVQKKQIFSVLVINQQLFTPSPQSTPFRVDKSHIQSSVAGIKRNQNTLILNTKKRD